MDISLFNENKFNEKKPESYFILDIIKIFFGNTNQYEIIVLFEINFNEKNFLKQLISMRNKKNFSLKSLRNKKDTFII